MKKPAKFVPCPGVTTDGRYGHSMRDHCWSCAPYWEVIPTCPVDSKKLAPSGFCKKCRKFYDMKEVAA